MNKVFTTLAATGLFAASAMATAADIGHGKDVATRGNCAACHGEGLNKPASNAYPKLAGQHADYIYFALRSYQAGDGNALFGRKNALMSAQVQNLSEDDLRDVAAYIESLPGDLVTKK